MLHSPRSAVRFLWLALVFAAPLLAGDCPPSGLTLAQPQARVQEIEARAGRLFQQGEFAKAAVELRTAACLAPASPGVHHALGLAEAAAGHFDRAHEALEQASRLAPRDFTILLARAQVEASLGKFDLVGRSLFEAAQIEPRGAGDVHAQLAR